MLNCPVCGVAHHGPFCSPPNAVVWPPAPGRGIPKIADAPDTRHAVAHIPDGTVAMANPKQAYGDAKIPVHRVPPALMLYAAIGCGNGAKKYGAFNWRETEVEAGTYYAALLRHMMAWFDGEDNDPDSGNPHLAHAAASLAILIDAATSGRLIDNRPAAGDAPGIMEEFAS